MPDRRRRSRRDDDDRGPRRPAPARRRWRPTTPAALVRAAAIGMAGAGGAIGPIYGRGLLAVAAELAAAEAAAGETRPRATTSPSCACWPAAPRRPRRRSPRSATPRRATRRSSTRSTRRRRRWRAAERDGRPLDAATRARPATRPGPAPRRRPRWSRRSVARPGSASGAVGSPDPGARRSRSSGPSSMRLALVAPAPAVGR